MGIEFRESYLSLTSKNTRKFEPGMVFNLTVGFQNLEIPDESDPKKKVYSLLLGDTVVIEEGAAKVLTESVASDLDSIIYNLGVSFYCAICLTPRFILTLMKRRERKKKKRRLT